MLAKFVSTLTVTRTVRIDGNILKKTQDRTCRKQGTSPVKVFLDEVTKRQGNNGRNTAAFTAPYVSDLHLLGYYA